MRIRLSLISLVLASSLFAQYRFDHLGTKDGLPQNSVNDIYQDSEGFLWFATQEGLSRYDGYEFVNYGMEGEMDMAGTFLWSIAEDSVGNIWTASPRGATRLNWREGSSTHYLLNRSEKFVGETNQVLRVLPRGSKVLVSFLERAFLLDPAEMQDSTSIVLSNRDDLQIGRQNNSKYLYNITTYKGQEYFMFLDYLLGSDSIPFPEGYKSERFKSKMFPVGNGILLGTLNGLLFYDVDQKSFEIIECVSEAVNDIIWGPGNKEIWVGTDNGLFLLNPGDFSCSAKLVSGEGEHDLSSSTVSGLLKSKDGLIWIGTANGGINIYDEDKDRFKFLGKDQGLSDKAIWSVFQTKTQLLAGADNGLYVAKLDDAITSRLFASQAISEVRKVEKWPFQKRITAIKQLSEDEFIIGTFDEEIILYNERTNESKVQKLKENQLSSHIVSAIEIIEENIWVTTHNGIFLFSKKLEQNKYFGHSNTSGVLPSNYHLTAFASKDNTLWIGGNVGIYTLTPDEEITVYFHDPKEPNKGPAFNFVTGFFEDKYGKIWMSTFGGGVSCFNRETETFSHFDKSDGLINNICSAILGTDSEIFVSSNGGISKIDIETKAITNYTTSDGLINNEFAISSGYQFGQDFSFGNVNGLVTFNPEELRTSPFVNQPVITKFSTNYQESLRSRISGGQIDLYPDDKIFSLEFSGMSYRKKDQVGYQYNLSGFSEEWVDAGPYDRRATYSLPPGNYQFHVRTVSSGMVSNTTTVDIIVHPAFYQTWWFYLLIGLASIVVVAVISRYYSHQQLKGKLRKMELQQKIQSERERISRDLHDNVGSQITYIATSINNMSGNGSSDELKELGEFTRDTMRQLRETIWVINNDEVSIAELKTKVLDYVSEILNPHPNIIHEVAFPESEQKFNPEKAINIFRLIQEAVNNAVKHANPDRIKIEFNLGETATITIEDDGTGFDGQDKIGHFGLINMRKRAQELGADFKLKTSPQRGTRIELRNFKIGQMT